MYIIIEKIFTGLGGLTTLVTIIVASVKYFRLRKWKRMFTWDNALRIAEKVLKEIQKNSWKPELVIGIGRSGGIWGGWLAGNLGSLPFGIVDDKYTKQDTLKIDFPGGEEIIKAILTSHPSLNRILIVKGAASRGDTFRKFKDSFAVILADKEIKFAVLYQNPTSMSLIDYVGEIGPEPWPEKFPWHHCDLYRPYLRDIFTSKK